MNRRTLFVLGAGASQEVGLPVGRDLTKHIANLLKFRFDYTGLTHGDSEMLGAISNASGRENFPEYTIIAKQIRDAMPTVTSIDDYIDNHYENSAIGICGKIAITKAILAAETSSKLYIRESKDIDFDGLQNTWFLKLFRIMSPGIRKEKIDTFFDKVSFINFNYDRCLEFFFENVLRIYYGIESQAAVSVVSKMPIIHPYGTVGTLPGRAATRNVGFGATVDPRDLHCLSQGIKTYTEQIEEGDRLTALHKMVSDAETIVFLGFAFHPQNMALLTPPDKGGRATPVYATGYGMSESGRQRCRERIATLVHYTPGLASIKVADRTCTGLFDEFGLDLKL